MNFEIFFGKLHKQSPYSSGLCYIMWKERIPNILEHFLFILPLCSCTSHYVYYTVMFDPNQVQQKILRYNFVQVLTKYTTLPEKY